MSEEKEERGALLASLALHLALAGGRLPRRDPSEPQPRGGGPATAGARPAPGDG